MKFLDNKKEQIKNTAKSIFNVKEFGMMNKDIKNILSDLSVENQIKNSRIDIFEDVVKKENLTSIDLQIIKRNLMIMFYLVFSGLIYCLFTLIYGIVNKHNIFTLMPVFGFGMIFLSLSFKYSFRHYQQKIKELCGVDKWFKDVSQWIPRG